MNYYIYCLILKKNFKLKGLDCANCAVKIEEKVKKIDGVEDASVSFMAQKLVVEINSDDDEILKKIRKTVKKEEPDVKVEEI